MSANAGTRLFFCFSDCILAAFRSHQKEPADCTKAGGLFLSEMIPDTNFYGFMIRITVYLPLFSTKSCALFLDAVW